MLLLSQASSRGASSSRKPALEMPQDKKPRRWASALMNVVFFDLLSIMFWAALAMEAASFLLQIKRYSGQRDPQGNAHLKKPALCICFYLPEMAIGLFGDFAATRCAHDKAFLNQERFVDFLDGFAAF